VKALVLVGVPLLRRDDRPAARSPLGYRLVKWAAGVGLVSQDRLEAARARHGSADYRAASGVMRDVLVAAVNEEYGKELAALRCPVRLVWGADDRDVPRSVAERAMRIIEGDVSLTEVDGVGHHVPIARPEAVRAAIEAVS
jgi:pimeloyl-ACP methyl ester carboxylesterase